MCETPEMFKIHINDKPLRRVSDGYFRDKSFKTLDIHDMVKEGDNIITFDCEFVQNGEFYKNLKNSWVFESEKNKLSYDMEIEPIYLIGDFGVKTEGEWTELDRNAVRYSGEFIIDKLPDNITINNIEQQGFPFFCGELELEGEIDVEGENPVLELDMKGVNAVRIEINDMEKTMLTDNRISLSDCERGRQKIKLTLINNLRNLLGPHHLKNGECYYVGPFSFYKENCIWNGEAEKQWDDDYCLVEFGCI